MNETKLATLLLQVFGYINATEEDVILKETTGLNYIYIEFQQKYITFRRINNQWTMEEE